RGDAALRRLGAPYTLAPPGMVARVAPRVPAAFGPAAAVGGGRFTRPAPDRMTAARRRVLEHAGDGLAWTRSGLSHAAGVSAGVVEGLRVQGVLETVMLPPRPVVADPDPAYAAPALSSDQQAAADGLRAAVRAAAFSVTLL